MRLQSMKKGKETNLEVSKLGELFATAVEATEVWLQLIVDGLVGSNIASLSEALIADVTTEWFLPSVTTFVCLLLLSVSLKQM